MRNGQTCGGSASEIGPAAPPLVLEPFQLSCLLQTIAELKSLARGRVWVVHLLASLVVAFHAGSASMAWSEPQAEGMAPAALYDVIEADENDEAPSSPREKKKKRRLLPLDAGLAALISDVTRGEIKVRSRSSIDRTRAASRADPDRASAPPNVLEHALDAVISGSETPRRVVLILQRSAEAGPFSENDRSLLTVLCEHLARDLMRHVSPPGVLWRRTAADGSGGVLSPRQNEILRMLLLDLTEDQIAQRLNRSPDTVHSHVRRIYQALGVRSRVQLVLTCRNPGGENAG
ncbi:MAG: helix-turn-helix transcriptional regulator [Phycisphaerae bacterium]|nr:helix-turn-helix transcriptional regulator [Phycisphaerae bacterium]